MNRRTVTGIVVLLVFPASVAALVATAPAPQEPRPTAFGDTAADLSEWREQASDEGFRVRTIVSDPEMVRYVPEPEATMVVIPQPRTPPSESMQDAWESHLELGGALLILDGSGATNRFLTGYGAAVTNRTILDPASGDPLAVRAQEPGRTGTTILGQAPSSLLIEQNASWEILLRSGPDTFLDIDGNGHVDRQDIPGPHVVAAGRDTQQGGRLMVVSSTTFFADHYVADLATGNHARLLDLVTDGLPSGATILIDESHHGWPTPENQVVGLVQKMDISHRAVLWGSIFLAIVAGTLVALLLTMSTVDRYRPHELGNASVDPKDLDGADGFFAAMADELRSRRPTQDADWLLRAVDGDLQSEDRVRLLQLYDSEVNQHA